jgi:glycosyltransferase involved in cell wall biosynthesis
MTDRSICFVIPKWSAFFAGTGGAELQCFYLSEELLKRGWQVEVLMRRVDPSKDLNHTFYNRAITYRFYDETRINFLDFFLIFSKLLGTRSGYYYNRTDARLLRATCGIYCRLFKKKKIFALANDTDVLDIPIHTKFKPGTTNIKDTIRFADAWITEQVIRHHVFSADYYITQTHTQQQLLGEKINQPSVVIRNSFRFEDTGFCSKENIILWVSNVRPQKRIELLADLLADLNIPGWRVVMIGNYSGYESVIENINNPCFEALGMLNFREALQWYAKSRILINTSSHEGFPNSFIQAWFYKCLVISYEFDPDQLLAEKELGFVANADFARFKALVLDCALHGNFNARVENAYNFAISEFSLEQNIEKFISLLQGETESVYIN